MTYHNPTEQRQNLRLMSELTVKHLSGKITPDGKWKHSEAVFGMRELMWCTNALFTVGGEENVTLANKIILANLPGYRHCHFMPFCIAQCYWHFESLLWDEAKQVLDEYFLKYLDGFKGEGMDFVGANDNFPCMASATMLFAYLHFGREDCYVILKKRLGQLRAMMRRSDFPCEYTSPTYTSVSLIALAEITSHVPDELRDMALSAEEWFWRDMLSHFHLPTAQMAPPHSRAYPIDYTACTHHARFSYWALLGSRLPITPYETIGIDEGCEDGMILHHDPDFLRISCVWTLLPEYHCPEELIAEAFERKYPCVVKGNSDPAFWIGLDAAFKQLPSVSERMPDYQGVAFQGSSVYTYMTEHYSFGTSRYPFLRGDQSSCIQADYVKSTPATKQREVKTLFTRYVVNDLPIEWDSSSFVDFGQKICVQHENSALAAYWPSPANNCGIFSLRLTLNISALYELPDEVWLGDVKLDDYIGEADGEVPIFIRDGNVCIAIHPIKTDDSKESMKIRIKPTNRVLEISFVNYEGEAVDFDRKTLLNMGCALAVTIDEIGKVESFEEFKRKSLPKIGKLRRANTVHLCCENGYALLGMQYNQFTRSVRWADVVSADADHDGYMSPDLI